MQLSLTTLAIRRAFVVGVCALVPLAPCAAQFRMAWDANAAVTQIDAPRSVTGSANAINTNSNATRWLGLSALGTTLQFDRSYGRIRADGLINGGAVETQASGAFNALLATPAWNGFRLSGSFDARRAPYYDDRQNNQGSLSDVAPTKPYPNWQATTSAKISFAHGRDGLWFGVDSRRGNAIGDGVSAAKLVYGYSRQLRELNVAIFTGIQSSELGGEVFSHLSPAVLVRQSPTDSGTQTRVVDSIHAGKTHRWSEVSTSVGWSHGRFSLDATITARPRVDSIRAALWGDGTATVGITSRLAVVTQFHSIAVAPGTTLPASRMLTAGLRISPPALRRPQTFVPTRSVTNAFDVEQTSPGEYIVKLRIPSARTVEIAGDFTNWKAVSLKQIDNTRWEVAVHVTTGAHRCNIRIDGAEWVPPPRVTTMDDEFNGRVGLIVIE